jgi:hypothetical protein
MNVSERMTFGRPKRLGESFLTETAGAGANLLLKGAYARGRQKVLGGTTRHIIPASTMLVTIAW